jgi:Lon protease-like protein
MIVPMFPLGSVFLPGDIVPLRIFEPRYIEMMQQMLAGQTEIDMSFASVLIARGSEVGGEDQRRRLGVVVHVEQCVATPEGGYGIVGLASDVVEIDEWLTDAPYPQAKITIRPDLTSAEGSANDLQQRVKVAANGINQMLQQMYGPNTQSSILGSDYLDAVELERMLANSETLNDALWFVARHLPAGPDIRYDFLSCRTSNDLMAALESGITHTQEMLTFLQLETD